MRELLGKRPAGGVYVALGGEDPRPRGLLRESAAAALGSGFVKPDLLPDDEFERVLDDVAAAVAEVAGRMARGELSACPDTCAFRGGCEYPGFCRCEAA